VTRWRNVVLQTDAAAVRRLVGATAFFSPEEQEVAVELVEEALARGRASGYEFLFADEAGEPGELTGYACFGRIPATRSSFDLYWIAVSPRAQREGLGSALLAAAEREAAAQGGTAMYVDTSGRAQYLPTRRFYERNGYAIAAEFADFYAPGDAKVVYRKSLPVRPAGITRAATG